MVEIHFHSIPSVDFHRPFFKLKTYDKQKYLRFIEFVQQTPIKYHNTFMQANAVKFQT